MLVLSYYSAGYYTSSFRTPFSIVFWRHWCFVNLSVHGFSYLFMIQILACIICRSLQPRGLAETLCGSPLYMAPEIMQLQKYDAKVIPLSFLMNLVNGMVFLIDVLFLFLCKTGGSLECWRHLISTCNRQNTIYWK